MPTANDVAAYFLSKTREEVGDFISYLKLQKLVYYAQGVHLALYGSPLFTELILAWEQGPAVPEIHGIFAKYNITPIITHNNTVNKNVFSNIQLEMLDDVYKRFGQYSAWKLHDMVCKEPTWQSAYPDGIISHTAMRQYFSRFIDG